MNNESFLHLLNWRILETKRVLGTKAGEYARGDDRLHNFKRVAEMKRTTPAEACIDGLCKHLVSILDMVDDLAVGKAWPLPVWDEKLGDAVNYLILLEAIIKEGANANGYKSSTVSRQIDQPERSPAGASDAVEVCGPVQHLSKST